MEEQQAENINSFPEWNKRLEEFNKMPHLIKIRWDKFWNKSKKNEPNDTNDKYYRRKYKKK